MKILVFTIGSSDSGSTRFRITQYLDLFKAKGFDITTVEKSDVDSTIINSIKDYDFLINQKCLFKNSIAKKIISFNIPILFDFDDAIYTRPGKPYRFLTKIKIESRFNFWLKNSNYITVANHYLKNQCGEHQEKVHVIPMSVDTHTWKPILKKHKKIVIGWLGNPVNFQYIEKINNDIIAIKKQFSELEFWTYSGEKPQMNAIDKHIAYQSIEEYEFINQIDIGLLPLIDEEHVRGKSPIKAIQYMSCGIPVLGNFYGATKEIVNHDNSFEVTKDQSFETCLRNVLTDKKSVKSKGENSQKFIVENHDKNKVFKMFYELINHARS